MLSVLTFTIAVSAGSQAFSRSCTNKCIELDITLKMKLKDEQKTHIQGFLKSKN